MKKILIFLFSISSLLTVAQNKETQTVEFVKLADDIVSAGTLHRATSFPSEHIQPRSVDVWLPDNYSENKKYSVLYMHDGQNLFGAGKRGKTNEWQVDEWSGKLMSAEKVTEYIVVAIYNIPFVRWQDLYPEKALDYMPEKVRDSVLAEAKATGFSVDLKGDEYLKFIVDELKPVIDDSFSVYPDKDSTFVAGSSMGGLMSMYAVAEYPEVFGGAACISTHWPGAIPGDDNPHPEAIFKYMEANLPKAKSHKFYFDYGNKTLDRFYPKFATRVDAIFKAKGYSVGNYQNLYFEGEKHSGSSWSKRMDKPILFLFGK